MWHPVTRAMNKPGYKEDDCAKPLKQGSIASFFNVKKRPSANSTDAGKAAKQAKTESPAVKDQQLGVKDEKLD